MKTRFMSLALISLAFLLALPQPGQAPVAAEAATASVAQPPVSVLPAPSLGSQLGDVIVASPPYTAYLPLVRKSPFNCYTGSSYARGIVYRGETPPIIPASIHPDKNLAIRGYRNAGTTVPGPTDQSGDYYTQGPRAPKLYDLFSPRRTPTPFYNYQVGNWVWNHDLPTHGYTTTFQALGTMIFLPATVGQLVTVPSSGYTIGAGMEVIVLYADSSRITLKIGREDTVAGGYTIHIEGICVDPNLVALYQSLDQDGMGPRYNNGSFDLPTLASGQPVGVASSNRFGVCIRDGAGTFMDARLKDWWVMP